MVVNSWCAFLLSVCAWTLTGIVNTCTNLVHSLLIRWTNHCGIFVFTYFHSKDTEAVIFMANTKINPSMGHKHKRYALVRTVFVSALPSSKQMCRLKRCKPGNRKIGEALPVLGLYNAYSPPFGKNCQPLVRLLVAIAKNRREYQNHVTERGFVKQPEPLLKWIIFEEAQSMAYFIKFI